MVIAIKANQSTHRHWQWTFFSSFIQPHWQFAPRFHFHSLSAGSASPALEDITGRVNSRRSRTFARVARVTWLALPTAIQRHVRCWCLDDKSLKKSLRTRLLASSGGSTCRVYTWPVQVTRMWSWSSPALCTGPAGRTFLRRMPVPRGSQACPLSDSRFWAGAINERELARIFPDIGPLRARCVPRWGLFFFSWTQEHSTLLRQVSVDSMEIASPPAKKRKTVGVSEAMLLRSRLAWAEAFALMRACSLSLPGRIRPPRTRRSRNDVGIASMTVWTCFELSFPPPGKPR